MLRRVKGRIVHRRLDRVSPLAVPVLLEIGREEVNGSALDKLLDDAAQALIAEAIETQPRPRPSPRRSADGRDIRMTQPKLL